MRKPLSPPPLTQTNHQKTITTAPKKKAQKPIKLQDFLAEDGAWADEMGDLPTAPASRNNTQHEYSTSNSYGGNHNDSHSQQQQDRYEERRYENSDRPAIPFPTQAPWTAFIGNLNFDIDEEQINNLFEGLGVRVLSLRKENCGQYCRVRRQSIGQRLHD